jgi:small subunit ribosomal protein S11
VATEAGRNGDDSLDGEEAREEVKGELRALERFKTCVDIRRYAAVRPWKDGALRATFVGALGKSTCRLNEVMLWCVVYKRQESDTVNEGQTKLAAHAFAAGRMPSKLKKGPPRRRCPPRLLPRRPGHARSKEFDLGRRHQHHLAVANHTFDMNLFRPLARLAARPSSIIPTPFTRAISSTPLPAAPITSRRGGALELGDWIGRLGDKSNGPPGIELDVGPPQPHRMHVYATKHNTHITFTQPPRKDPANPGKQVDVLMSLSAGNIGFKKAGRGSYDAAYQLAAFVLKQIQERGLMRDLHSLEVVMRGFGKGREAVTKALLGSEGYLVRNKISSVKDATRLKFGGSRSPKPRRLG